MRYCFILFLIVILSCGCSNCDHIVNDCEVVSRSVFSEYMFLESAMFNCLDGRYRCFYTVKGIDCERL